MFIATGLAVPVNGMLSPQTLALGEALEQTGNINTIAGENALGSALEEVLQVGFRHKSGNPAKMARLLRNILSASNGGQPIRTYLAEYGPLGSSTEMEMWLEGESSPPAIFMIERFSGMPAKTLFREAFGRPGKLWPSLYWANVAMTLDPSARGAIATCIIGMKLDTDQIRSVLRYEFSDFPKHEARLAPKKPPLISS
ncbi:hypothetical protein FRB95_004727 [Tulasnella sp. JGI-2019a]|nr:hypothetical protein FRB95_004727 [Tulasnella sp. JGI-2019a]